VSAGAVWLSGATGLVGGRLLPRLRAAGRPLRAVSRRPGAARLPEGVTVHGWDGTRPPAESLSGCAAAVHLAGEPLFGPPGAARRERMRASRVASTRALVAALGALPAERRPGVLVCASAVGIYGDRGEAWVEEDAEPGTGFLAELCREWEAAAAEAGELGVRVVSLRIAVVLAREGGALAALRPVFRLGLGGPLGDGSQWFPWIHADDLARLVCLALERDALRGAVNAAAPAPVRNRDFARELGRALGRPALLRVPGFVLRAALGPLAGELLDSRRVRPARALAAGFAFHHASLASALAAELGGP
jgi:hypothetical protein